LQSICIFLQVTYISLTSGDRVRYDVGMSDAEDEDRALRMEQMRADIANKTADTEYKRGLLRYEPWKLVLTTGVSALLAVAAAVGAGVGVGNLIWAHREAPPVAAPFVFPPGTVITIPPTR
jgi:hypothetical protein